MKWSGKLIILFLFFSGCSPAEKSKAKLLSSAIIPQPQQLELKPGFFTLPPNTVIDIADSAKLTAGSLLDLFATNFQTLIATKATTKKQAKIFIKIDKKLIKESYKLLINEKTICITASDKSGFFYAFQTINQLINLNNNKTTTTYNLPAIEIFDWPEYEHRGMLLDCCRHFFSVETIKTYLELMSYYKMNVLHWHLTEDQGWRIPIEAFPKLTSVGAYRQDSLGLYGNYYSKKQMKELVAYAHKLNINIIPEIELPGHSQAAIAAYPNLSCTGKQYPVANDWGVFKEIYCAGNDSVFFFLEKVLEEVIEIFPCKYIHIGGDEAPKFRWENCSKCQNRISKNNLKDEHELQSYFIKRISSFLQKKNKTIIGWDEILEGGLPNGAIVQSWRGTKGGELAVKNGHKAIMSPTSHAYFDYEIKTTNLSKVYSFNPRPGNLTPKQKQLIIGGECNVWSEHINNKSELDNKVFPRLIAMAEVLWTNKQLKNFNQFKTRLSNHYPILSEKGINYGIEDLPCQINTLIKDSTLKISLRKSDTQIKLNYHWNHEKDQRINDSIIPFNKSGTLTVQAFKNNRKYGPPTTKKFTIHKGLNSTINYQSPYNSSYRSNGDLSLIDGTLGSMDFKDNAWQGFWDTNLSFALDLKEVKEISNIGANFYQYNNSWILFPKSLTIETSLDSISWTSWGTTLNKKTPKLRGKNIQHYEIKQQKIKARYVKVIADRHKKIPSWHEAAGAKTWLFIDELTVK